MRLLILGSTGRTGRLIVKEALRRGYRINVLVRDKKTTPFYHHSIRVFEGLPTNQSDLAIAMQGCKVIISALNISRISDFPWARLRTPENFLSETMKNVIANAITLKINRIITISAWGVYEEKKNLPFWFRWLIDHSNIAAGYKEHEAQEEILKNSGLNWTSIRPVILSNSKKQRTVKVSDHNEPITGLFISRYGVAQFALKILHHNRYYKKSPVIFFD